MDRFFKYFKVTMEDMIKPFMENKKAICFLLALAIGGGAYTTIDLLGRTHVDEQELHVPISEQVKEVIKSTGVVKRTDPEMVHCTCQYDETKIPKWFKPYEELH